MTPERFTELLDSYGSDPRRWPEAERQAALALAEAGLGPALDASTELDGWLDAYAVPAPGDALAARILAAAPAPKALPARGGSAWTRLRSRWHALWPVAGLAGAGLAGSLAGAFAVSIALKYIAPPDTGEWPVHGSAFTELYSDWSQE
jgi:hypothetical protein